MSKLNSSKLVALIKSLSKDDLKQMARFLESPYHNSNKKLPAFFEAVRYYAPDFEHKNFTAERIYKKLYPGRPFNNNAFQVLKSELIQKINAYLAFEEIKRTPGCLENFTGKALGRRDHYTNFRVTTEQRAIKIENRTTLDLHDFKCLQQIYHDLFFHPQTAQESKVAVDYMNKSMAYLDCFYCMAKVIYSAELLSHGKVNLQNYNIALLEESMQLATQTSLKNNSLFQLYTLAVELIRKGDEQVFTKLKTVLFENTDKLPEEGKRMAVIVLSNFAFPQYGKGKFFYQQELFQLYQFREKENLCLNDSIISGNSFINIVVTASACGDFKWARYFIKKYKDHIKPTEQADALKLSKAFMFFYNKKYDKTLKLLSTIKERSYNTNMRIRSLRVRTYYELSLLDTSYYNVAVAEITNLRAFLRNHKGNKYNETAYLNFCKICMKLLKATAPQKVLQMMKNMEELKFRVWLQRKAEDGFETASLLDERPLRF